MDYILRQLNHFKIRGWEKNALLGMSACLRAREPFST